MTRIISGAAGGLKLQVPKSGTRPTSDRVREAVFSTLESWDFIAGVRVLDLFAGSGALGIEALSRGAASAVFVEKHAPAAAVVRANIQALEKMLGPSDLTRPVTILERASAGSFMGSLPGSAEYDVVFVDPPYDFSNESLADLLVQIERHLALNGVVMVERDRRSGAPALPPGISPLKEKRYGETTIWWLEKSAEN